jgi:hypothetical protein
VNFLSPLMLVGLLAVAIPPIIHLLLRRKPKVVRFSALEFIMRSHRKTARRFRFRQLALMLMRSLLIALVVLAVARPLMVGDQADDARAVVAGGAAVIVLDASYPMQFLIEGETLFERARHRASNLLDQSGLRAGLVIAGSDVETPFDELTADMAAIRRQLNDAEPTQTAGQLGDAMGRAYGLLNGVSGQRAVIVYTTRAGALRVPPPPSDGPAIDLKIIDAAEGRPTPNRSVVDVQVNPAPQMGAGYWQILARIANHSADPQEQLPVRLEIEGETVVNGFVDTPAWSETVKSFYVTLSRAEVSRAAVKIADDSLPVDDRYDFWLQPAPSVKVLAVNGDPNPTPHRDELFYIRRMVEPAIASGAQIKLTTIDLETVSEHRFQEYDVVLLANIVDLSVTASRSLASFVKAGGGLLVTMGGQVRPRELNEALGSVLPRTLRSVRQSGDAAATKEGGDRSIARIADFSSDHPLIAPIPNPESSSLRLVKIKKYMLLDPAPTAGGEVALALQNGAPLLLSKAVGEGRVVMLTTSLDRDWSDLPIRPHFLPLMVHTLQYLTQTKPIQRQVVFAGRSAELKIDDGQVRRVKVQTPTGGVHLMERPTRDGEKWAFAQTGSLGHYGVHSVEGQDEPMLSGFTVRVDPSLGNLNGEKRDAAEGDAEVRSAGAGTARTELWHAALLLLFALLLAEGGLLFRRRRSEGVTPTEMGTAQARPAPRDADR